MIVITPVTPVYRILTDLWCNFEFASARLRWWLRSTILWKLLTLLGLSVDLHRGWSVQPETQKHKISEQNKLIEKMFQTAMATNLYSTTTSFSFLITISL